MSNEEKVNKKDKILQVIKVFLENPDYTILDVSRATGISKSSVQRYLTNKNVESITTPQVANYISNKLKNNRKEATILGGKNSKKNNVFVKDQNGKFMGSVKNID